MKHVNVSGDRMERIIFHIDVNNAFLSWTAIELLNKGYKYDIRNSYAVIGGDETKRRGIVLAKSPSAKKLGIITGETLTSARRKCKVLKIYPPNYKWYQQKSNELFNLLSKYTPDIEIASIDECYLDYGKIKHLYGEELKFAEMLKKEIYTTLGFTVNIGIANNKLCAKMASDFDKPDKVHTLFENEIKEKMWPLKTNDLFMLGKKTFPVLYNMGIKTIGDLAQSDVMLIQKRFGKFGKMMWEYANGIDDSPVNYMREKPKSISNSTTLPMDVTNIDKLYEVLFKLTESVTYRLRKEKLIASTVNVQIRTNKFVDSSHQGKLINPTSNTIEIYEKAKELLDESYKPGVYVRLLGVRVDNLIKIEDKQFSFFEDVTEKKHEKIDETLDKVKEKYGYNSITRGRGINLKD